VIDLLVNGVNALEEFLALLVEALADKEEVVH
jgi:hypothetical protein